MSAYFFISLSGLALMGISVLSKKLSPFESMVLLSMGCLIMTLSMIGKDIEK